MFRSFYFALNIRYGEHFRTTGIGAAELQAAEIIARKLHLVFCDQVSFFGHRRTLQRKLTWLVPRSSRLVCWRAREY